MAGLVPATHVRARLTETDDVNVRRGAGRDC
jgi:hypothetical protein